ncbi:MAG: cation diffusion facilitator family transporter [Pseudomonadota bacterium]
MTAKFTKTTVTKRRAAAVSVGSNTFLVLGKLVAGVFTGSVAVISEAIHSAMDLLAAVIAFFAVTFSGRPPDDDHSHGHGKIENLSGAVEALLIFGAVVFIGYEAIHKLVHGTSSKHMYLGIITMGVSAAINVVVSWYLQRIGEKTESHALLADAAHLRTDVYTSLGVLIGLFLVHFTGLQWLDPVAALLVALIIVWEAWQITRESVGDLLDQSLPVSEQKVVENVIQQEGLSFHAMRSRKSGATRSIDLHLDVSPKATAEQIHSLCDRIENNIQRELPQAEVLIHPEPVLELDNTLPVRGLMENLLNRHRDLFGEFSDLCIHEEQKGILIVFRLHLEQYSTLEEFQRISEHLTRHAREHLPGAQLLIHPELVRDKGSKNN